MKITNIIGGILMIFGSVWMGTSLAEIIGSDVILGIITTQTVFVALGGALVYRGVTQS